VALLAGATVLAGCAGGGGSLDTPEGAVTPEEAVETFMTAAQTAKRARDRGALTEADQAYDRMAAVFGTESGSIRRSRSAEDVRSRMIVLSACLRPASFRIVSRGDVQARGRDRVVVTVELTRERRTHTLPFRVIRGRGDQWFIEQIELGSFSC
jgi:hypothetical protein